MATIRKFAGDRSAATSIEYAMIAAGIAVAIVAVVTALGGNVNAMYTSVSAAF
jgi:pilus assembly protein Flp/PilA